MSRATPKDLGLALLVAFLVAQGPLTPPALGPSVVAGALVAGAFLYFRLSKVRARRRALADPGRVRESVASPRWEIPIGVWLCLAVLAVVFVPTWVWMYGQWTGSVWHNTHGLIVPVLMVMLSRNILRRMKPVEDTPSAWGFAFLVPGLLLVVLDTAAGSRYMGAFGFVLTLPGLSLLLLGPRRTRALALPLVLGIFMMPLPNMFATQIYLRTVVADGVGPVLTFLGIPTLIQGSILELPQSRFLVSNACSGFSTLYSTVALAVLLGARCESWTRRVVIYLSILPLALLANVVRVAALVLIFLYVDPNILASSAHSGSGVVTFLAVTAVLILLADRPSLRRALL